MNWIALLAVMVSLIIMYVIGTFVTAPFKKENTETFYDTFVKLVVGFISITTVYAIVRTGGNTVQLGFVLLAAIICIQNRHSIEKPHFKKIGMHIVKMLVYILMASLFFFAFHGYFYYADPVNNIPHLDHYVYSFNAFNNDNLGIETNGVYLDGMPKASPYHYIEGWLVAIIANIFSLNYLETFSICVMTILSVIVSIGIIALTRKIGGKGIVFLFAFCTIFLSAVLLSYSPIKQHMAMGENVKNLVSAIFLLGFVIDIKKKSNNSYFWLLCLPICNASLAPIIMMALFFFYIVRVCNNKNRREYLRENAALFLTGIFIALFYLLQRKTTGTASSSNGGILIPLINSYSFSNLCHMAYRTVINYAMYFPYFLPLIFIAIIDRKSFFEFFKENRSLLPFFALSVVSGFVCHYAYYPINNYDSGQMDINVNLVFMSIWVLLSLVYVSTKVHFAWKWIFIVLWGIFSIYNVWVFSESIISRRSVGNDCDIRYRTDVINYFKDKKVSHIGGRLISEVTLGFSFKNTNDLCTMAKFGNELDGIAAINLSQMNLSQDQSHWNSIRPQSNIFNGYLSSQESTNADSLRLEFIRQKKLEFLKIDSSVEIPINIEPYIDTMFTDAKTGERFIFLSQIENK